MPARPEFWIVAGPNGAGKTTCVQKAPVAQIIPGVPFLNPDDRTRAKFEAEGYRSFAEVPPERLAALFIAAADEVYSELDQAIASGRSIGVETVLSTEKYRSLVEAARARDMFVGLIYIALKSSDIALQRVAMRVRLGGHDVPADRIGKRWAQSLKQLPWFVHRASSFWIIDNSDSDPLHPPSLIAWGAEGQLTFLDDAAFLELQTALSSLPR